MTARSKNSALLGDALLEAIRQAGRGEIREAMRENGHIGQKPIEISNKCYFTIKEAAAVSRLGPSTIRLYIRKRELKAHKVGERVIIKRADLERFLEAHPIEVIDN